MKRRRRSAARPAEDNFFRLHGQVIALGVLIAAGLLLGALLAKQAAAAGQASFANVLRVSFSTETASKGFWWLTGSSFLSSSLLVFAAYICGLCAAGQPVLAGIPLFKGAGLGFTVGYLYIEYGMKGLMLSAFCVLPENLIVCVSLILACRAAFRYSWRLLRTILPTESKYELWDDFVRYSVCCGACLCLNLAAAVLEAAVVTGLHGYLL